MRESRFFIKRLSVAEAETNNNNVHELYIRLSNDFDYQSFFQNEGYINEKNTRQIDFEVQDVTFGNEAIFYPLHFAFYENSNKEKRIPSMREIFNKRGVKAGDIVCLESRTTNEITSFYISFNRGNSFPMSDDSVYYSIKTDCKNQLDTYKSLSIQQREAAFAYYISNFEDRTIGEDQVKKYSHTYIPHINKYVSKLNGYSTLYEITSLTDFEKVAKIASKDSNPDPNYPGAYKSAFNKYGRFLREILSEACRINLSLFGVITPQYIEPLQLIFYGAPGTGKSFGADNFIKNEYKNVEECRNNVFRTTFHPDSDYSSFVGCYKPITQPKGKVLKATELIAELNAIKVSGVTYPCHKFSAKYWESLKDLDTISIKNILSSCGFTDSMITEVSKSVAIGQELASSNVGRIAYEFVPQVFSKAYVQAWKNYMSGNDKKVFLLIEEINRGNCAQIFGDLFQLLDRDDDTCRSQYPIKPDTDLGHYIADSLADYTASAPNNLISIVKGEEMLLPNNFYIWATMNTSDQSLFPIDSAFKRRWDWKFIKIAKGKDKNGIELEWKIDIIIDDNGNRFDWYEFLEKINVIINSMTQSADKQLGFFFCKAKDGLISVDTFVNKVLFYLWNDVFKDYGYEDSTLFTYKFKNKDGKDEDGILSFPAFFKDSGVIDKDVVRQFISNVMSWGSEKTEKKEE